MSHHATLDLHQSAPSTPLPGCWKLDGNRAISLQPRAAGTLKVARGQIWVTFDGPHQGHGNESGDVVLNAGEKLRLRPGQRLVMEPWGRSNTDAAWFSWDPVLNFQPRTEGAESRMNVAVVQPLRDLGLALGLVATALGRLVFGVLGLSEFLVAGRGRVLAPMESNQP